MHGRSLDFEFFSGLVKFQSCIKGFADIFECLKKYLISKASAFTFFDNLQKSAEFDYTNRNRVKPIEFPKFI